jgi:hypothetical protein
LISRTGPGSTRVCILAISCFALQERPFALSLMEAADVRRRRELLDLPPSPLRAAVVREAARTKHHRDVVPCLRDDRRDLPLFLRRALLGRVWSGRGPISPVATTGLARRSCATD